MSIPGIGWIVASQLLARIGNWRELKNIRQLAGFLGLAPTENSTGERTERGSITHSGDGRLRSKLVQASWSAIRQDAELREFFRSVCRTHPRNIAPRVAIGKFQDRCRIDCLREIFRHRIIAGHFETNLGAWT
ncbi:MAG: transposase [Nitrospirales bacterium]